MRRIGPRVAVIVATMIAIGTTLLLSNTQGVLKFGRWHVARGALDADCSHSGRNPDDSVQFIVGCPATSLSPDGNWTVRLTPMRGPQDTGQETYDVLVVDKNGQTHGSIGDLNDFMPFVLLWSPRPNWFLVNHWQGSFSEQPRVFEIADTGVVEHDSFLLTGQAEAIRRNPCLGDGSFERYWGRPRVRNWATGTAHRWSRDGRRIIWHFSTRIDACMDEGDSGAVDPEDVWHPFFMISDVETGAVDPVSIRIIDDKHRGVPTDGPYANF